MSEHARVENASAGTPGKPERPDKPEPSETRTVTAEVFAACPFSIAHEYAADYFHLAEAGGEEAEIRVPIRFLPLSLRRRVGLSFASHPDASESGRAHDEIRIRWNAGTRFLPDFHGAVRFRIAGVRTRVIVEGSYQAPFGAAGRIFDNLIGSAVARVSAQDLCARVASYLELRNREWEARVDAPPTAK